MRKQYWKIAFAYVGVIVGAGLSSGQDLLQYFLCFGEKGLIGVILLGILNVLFGTIMVTLGSYYRSENHSDVLSEIVHPITNRIIDITLIIASFIMGFVMIAGAGSNLKQQLGLPGWMGALLCSLLIIVVAFLDFDKITGVLGVFTPIIVGMILLITAYTFLRGPHDFAAMDTVAKTIEPALPNLWLSVVNYYALCAMTGVSMAFILGGSVIRIGTAKKGGMLGGIIIGVIITAASLTLFVRINLVKDAEIPMLAVVNRIHPALAYLYAFTIFALIFNTAFSLYYSIARRFDGGSPKRMRLIMIGIVAAGFVCSFGGFRKLISLLYPVIGYMGSLLLLILAIVWVRERKNIIREKFLRRKMIRLVLKKHDEDRDFTERDHRLFHRLSEYSAADSRTIRSDARRVGKKIADHHDDLQEFADKHLPVDDEKLRNSLKKD